MDDPAPNLDVAEGGGEAQHLAPLAAPPLPPPPPPAPPPAQLAPPPPSPSFWPSNDPTVCFFMDPFSPKVQETKRIFEITSQAYGQTFPSTADARLASHLVLDLSNDDNQFLRRLAPEKVVSLRWLEDGFMKPSPPPEDQDRLGGFEEKKKVAEGKGDRGGGGEREKQRKVASTSTSLLHPLSDYVNPEYASRGGWLKSEEEELARFLASDPQPDEKGRSIWDQSHLAHTSRNPKSYQKHYISRKNAYFDAKIVELGGTFDTQPTVHEHADDKEADVQIREPVVSGPRTASKASSRDGSSSSEEEEDQSSDASSEEELEGPTHRTHHRSSPSSVAESSSSTQPWNQEDRKDLVLLLAKYPGSNLTAVAKMFMEKHPRYSVSAIMAHYRRTRKAYEKAMKVAASGGSGTSLDSVIPASGKGGSQVKWTKEEDADLVGMLVRRKGSKTAVYNAFSEKHPRRPFSAVLARCQDGTRRIDDAVAALQRKEGKQSKSGPAVSRFKESVEDDSMGDDEDSDDDETDLRTPTSAPSSSSFFIDRKRPQESQQGSSSKRTKVDSPANAVASSSKSSSSSSHYHRNQSHHQSSSNGYDSGSNFPLDQPGLPLPSFTRRVGPGPTSFAHPQPFLSGSLHAQPLSPPSIPLTPEFDSSSGEEDEDLEPESFLTFGTKPTSCPPGAPCCWFCGFFDEDGLETFQNLQLAEKNLDSGEVEEIKERLACGVCETTWERRFVRKLKLDDGVAEMGELERLEWVTRVLLAKGRAERTRRVKG